MPHSLLLVAEQSDVVRGAGLAVVTVGVVFAVLLVLGFAVVMRRNRSRKKSSVDLSGQRSDIALVRLDDDVASSTDELGFAIAQFGDELAAPLASALTLARSNLAAAFRLKQQLDDATPDSPASRREWNARILMLCEAASEKLAAERASFDALRGRERSAAHDLREAVALLDLARGHLPASASTLATLSAVYPASAVAPVEQNIGEATNLIESGARHADAARSGLDESGVGSVSASIGAAERDARRSIHLLDDVERYARQLAESSARLDSLVAVAGTAVDEARVIRNAAPDPETGGVVAEAIAYVQRALDSIGANGQRTDPDASIARIEAATDALDTAVAGVRNQEQRLAHAREALAGALLAARSQVETTRSYIGGRRGGAGAEARTRLAEAERLLGIAEAESDPVLALDLARSSATYSRDADALARYDLMH